MSLGAGGTADARLTPSLSRRALRAVFHVGGAVATATVRALAGALFLAGLGRAGGWLAVGRPHGLQVALLIIELTAPPPIVAWQARLAGHDWRGTADGRAPAHNAAGR